MEKLLVGVPFHLTSDINHKGGRIHKVTEDEAMGQGMHEVSTMERTRKRILPYSL